LIEINNSVRGSDSTRRGLCRKEKEIRAIYQANDYGNGKPPLNVYCQNLAAQIQVDGNAMNIIGVQGYSE
jgi:hypothetical protein